MRTRQVTVNGVVFPFSANQFRLLLSRNDIDWPISVLAVESGVHRNTLNAWISGARKPRQDELARVLQVLAIDICVNCGGNGMQLPTEERLAEVTQGVLSQPTPLPKRPAPPIDGRPIIRGAFVLNPGLRRLMLGETVVPLTTQECRLLVHLATHSDRYVSSEELGEAIWQPGRSRKPSAQAARVCLSRLLTKLATAGVARLIETRTGGGYRLEEVSA